MNSDSESFDELRKLLVLKRHEQPPPGYFNRFSDQVIARIKAGDRVEEAEGWFAKFRSFIETKPMITGAFGAALCALALAGIALPDDVDSTSDVIQGPVVYPTLAGGAGNMALNQVEPSSRLTFATNLVSPQIRALFDQTQLSPQQAGFGFPSGN